MIKIATVIILANLPGCAKNSQTASVAFSSPVPKRKAVSFADSCELAIAEQICIGKETKRKNSFLPSRRLQDGPVDFGYGFAEAGLADADFKFCKLKIFKSVGFFALTTYQPRIVKPLFLPLPAVKNDGHFYFLQTPRITRPSVQGKMSNAPKTTAIRYTVIDGSNAAWGRVIDLLPADAFLYQQLGGHNPSLFPPL